MRKAAFYRRLFINYISIIILYTVVAMLLFFIGMRTYYNKQSDSRNQYFLEQYVIRVDEALTISRGIADQLLTQKEVRRFILFPEIDYHNITMIYHRIHDAVTPFDRLGLFVALGKNDHSMVITSAGTANQSTFYQQMGFSFNDQPALYRQLAAKPTGQSYVLRTTTNYYGLNQNLITLINRRPFTNNNDLLSYMSFQEESLFPEIKGEEEMVIVADNQVVVRRGTAESVVPINQREVFFGEKTKDDERRHQLQEKGYQLYQAESSVEGLTYYYIVKQPTLMAITSEIFKRYGIWYLLLILVGAFGAVIVAKKTYEPVAKIVNKIKQQYKIDEVKDEFDLIERTSEEMTKDNLAMKATIRKNRAFLKVKFLRDLLYGLSDEDAVEENLIKYQLPAFFDSDQLVAVLVLEIINHLDVQDQYIEDKHRSVHREVQSAYKQLFDKLGQAEIIEMDSKRTVVIFSNDEAEGNALEKPLEKLLCQLEDNYGVQTLAILGESVERLEDIGRSYGDAVNQLEFRNMLPKNKLIKRDYLKGLKVNGYYYPLDVEQNLIYYVENQKEEEMHLLLEHLLKQNFQHHSIGSEAISMFVFAVTGTIHRILNRQNIRLASIYDEGTILYLELKMIDTQVVFKERLHQVFQKLLDQLMSGNQVGEEESIGQRLIDYIHTNYQEDISLNDLASYFSLTPAYISALFKKEHGTNFKDYVNHYKIEQVKKRIKATPDMKNQELAAAVGYNSVNTFLRLFKKYTGMTPGKYAEKHRHS